MQRAPTGIVRVLKGKIGTLVNAIFKHSVEAKEPAGYRLVNDLTPIYSAVAGRVGMYENKKGMKVIIKKCSYAMEDLNAVYMRNEGYILAAIGQAGTAGKMAPAFVDLIEYPHHLMLVTAVSEGRKLDTFEPVVSGRVIQEIYGHLQRLSTAVKEHDIRLPVRSPFSYIVGAFVNLIKLMGKDVRNTFTYIRLTGLFYIHYFIGSLRGIPLGLVHRDLYPDNILYEPSTGSSTVLDWESAVVSDSLYDLAQIAMIYTKIMGEKSMISFLKQHLETNAERRRFIGLALFNSLQILSNNRPGDEVFTETREFINALTETIIPAILYKKTPYELVYGFTLDCIAAFYAITRLPMRNPGKKIILCYHSVGNDGWRFSTRIRTFADHVSFLKHHYAMKSLPALLGSSAGGVNISFDDGYQSVLDNALPILKKAGVPATMFVIGDTAHANREELDNDLPFMDSKGIGTLHDNGWEIGYHTATHPNLGRLTQAELDEELVEGKNTCEKKLGLDLAYFAYPKGIYTEAVVETVRRAGFKAAFTVDGAVADAKTTGNLLIDRVPIDGELTARQLGALLSPLGLRMAWIYMKLLVLKERYITSRFRYAAA